MEEQNNIDINQLVQRLGNKLATFEIQIEVMAMELERLKNENELLKEEKKGSKCEEKNI